MPNRDLRKFEIKEIPDPDPYVYAACECCDWEGVPGDCETHTESDGWENPDYEVATCPKCEEDCVIFLKQSDMEAEPDAKIL